MAVERFQGDAATQDDILRLVDDGHAPGTQRAEYSVAFPEDHSDRGVQRLTPL